MSQSIKYLIVNYNICSTQFISVFYSNTEINDLRSHCQYHINENSKYEKEAADNSEYIMMQHDVAAENMNTRYYYGSTYWHNLENQEGQQR